jgi:integrase
MRRRSSGQGTLFKRTVGGPFIAKWFDHAGRRKEQSTRTTDLRTAERILSKHVNDACLRRDGVVDAAADGYLTADKRPLAGHVEEYLDHCLRVGRAAKHIAEKVRILRVMLAGTGVVRLSELTADTLERHLWALQQEGKAARTVNMARQTAVAFMSWCRKTGRIETNPLDVVPKLDETRDRRRVRRPLSAEEMVRLLDVATPRGRRAWYMTAAMAGLRLGDLRRLTWGDIDFQAGTITITDGKAHREDVLPIHEQLAEELAARRKAMPALPMTRVFPEAVTNITVQKDLLRAGLARREVVLGTDGNPVMIGKGKRQRPLTRITTADEQGRVVDLHALRTTLGTNLALAGVAPQLAQRVMRHADYRTTLKHYTVLGIADTSKAINALSRIESAVEAVAAVAGGGNCRPNKPQQHPQLYPHQLARETMRFPAMACAKARDVGVDGGLRKPLENTEISKAPRDHARPCDKAGEEIRTPDVQLGKLTFYH